MIIHPTISTLFIVNQKNSLIDGFLSYLNSTHHVNCDVQHALPSDLTIYDVVVTSTSLRPQEWTPLLSQFVASGGGWLELVDLSKDSLPAIFGTQPNPPGPSAEVRVLFENRHHPLAVRLPDAVYLPGHYHSLKPFAQDAETLLYADWHYRHEPVLITRMVEKGRVACTTLQAYDHPVLQQILHRLLRQLAGQPAANQDLGVGILGYAPSVGKTHGTGAEITPGLALRAVCDLNPARLDQASKDFSHVTTYPNSDDLCKDPDIDVVIIATAPNIHASLCLHMMEAGKHVVCEKPLALTRTETDALVSMAERQQVHLSCHQNRRWDVDYLAIKQAVRDGLIGDLFYMETFVGSFNHPCGYWHSHAPVSGGTAYDWGGHYIDWIVSLIPDQVEEVIGTRHKRVWHDVTNADQERIQIRFAGGQEADFLHSDIAAIRKPKWYLLGTEGAIIGHWKDISSYEIDPDLYFFKHDIPVTEAPPDLILHRRHSAESIAVQKLSLPRRDDYCFHRNLADHLLTGEPIEAPLEQSVTVVAILEAASRSAAHHGKVEKHNG